jgi:hypothetical protein
MNITIERAYCQKIKELREALELLYFQAKNLDHQGLMNCEALAKARKALEDSLEYR